jgi:hypothetical protein
MTVAKDLEVLYVTSFGPDMYVATGVHLVESFLTLESEGQMLCCHEGAIHDMSSMNHERVQCYNLDASEFLHAWLSSNKDIIPVALGGDAQRCSCSFPDDPYSQHRDRCPFTWFNKNASRWFRKIVSLERAMEANADLVVWIDSDCRFVRKLPAEIWSVLRSDCSVLYHKSAARSVVESGVIAFRMDEGGKDMLRHVIEYYRSGDFRAESRWDDGYIFQQMIERYPNIISKDLARESTPSGHVLPSSPLGPYLHHYKDVHGPVLRLLR